ncbi:MAG: DUF1819 family protein, partial [SAR324 cluster bacterium]|nr:DUF1819 family protein [SAR324 cluster bacterium]
SETAIELNKPNSETLAQVSRAINLKKIVDLKYQSLSSGETERKIAPFAIANSGLRWHVRAFDRKTAELMVQNTTEERWSEALLTDNILQKRSPLTIKKQDRVIRNRLELMIVDFYELITKGNQNLVKQSLLAAVVKQSQLLGDFLQQVVMENHKNLKKIVTDTD